MKTTFYFVATTFVIAFSMLRVPAWSNPPDAEGTHRYTIGVDGGKDVKLRMLLIAKPTANGAPTRQSRFVTVPFETTFQATAFYVWFDTLDDHQSGKEDDRIMGMYKVDGEPQGGGFGGTLKTANKKSFSFGNL